MLNNEEIKEMDKIIVKMKHNQFYEIEKMVREKLNDVGYEEGKDIQEDWNNLGGESENETFFQFSFTQGGNGVGEEVIINVEVGEKFENGFRIESVELGTINSYLANYGKFLTTIFDFNHYTIDYTMKGNEW